MEQKFFLMQIKRTNNNYEKGIVIKDSLIAARQSFHAYLGAYGYEKDANTDYVALYIYDSYGNRYDWMIDDRRNLDSELEE